ncbi:hypothetical protein MHZ93_16530 [Roseomonas sp. ACRSG]|nr:hypothetical protein [Roseomonas sp. ACRSG]
MPTDRYRDLMHRLRAQHGRKPVTKIQDLVIDEVSLVDVPANPHAQVLLFKRGEGPAQRPPAPAARRGGMVESDIMKAAEAIARRALGLEAAPMAKAAAPQAQAISKAGSWEALAKSGAALSHETWRQGLREIGHEAAALAGVGQIDPATAEDLGLRSPAGAAILKAMTGAAAHGYG